MLEYIKTLLTWDNAKPVLSTFIHSFLAVFVLGVVSVYHDFAGGHWDTGKDALVALSVAAGAAGIHSAYAYLKTKYPILKDLLSSKSPK